MSDPTRTGIPDVNDDATWPGVAAAYAAWPGDQAPGSGSAAAPGTIPPPREHLDPKARTIWFINNLIATIVITAVVTAAMVGAHMWFDAALLWTILVPVVVALILLTIAWLDPLVRYRIWRFEIHEDEVDLQHGFFTRTRQLVPMSRIQHVDTRQGPLDRRYRLASVIFYTAAGAISIPALSVGRAAEVRSQ
ncbi:MAG TPA: PH domain-containing protein, partial [Thermomicrobiales bacterium]|nr:PH domain-containing protein [Thermomicrobiales bacterium]